MKNLTASDPKHIGGSRQRKYNSVEQNTWVENQKEKRKEKVA